MKRRFWPTSKDFAWNILEAEVRKNDYKIGFVTKSLVLEINHGGILWGLP